MANTYEAIATQTLGSAAASVTFSSIPGTYTDLVLAMQPSSNASDFVLITFNGDTASNYSMTTLNGNGTSAVSARTTSQTSIRSDWYAYPNNTLGTYNQIVNVMNYSNATTYKTILSRSNNASNGVEAVVGLWRSTAAITSIVLTIGSGTMGIGSTFSLYGIAAA
jgi:hypothetical protein